MSQTANASTNPQANIDMINTVPQATDQMNCSPKIPHHPAPFPDGGFQTDWPGSIKEKKKGVKSRLTHFPKRKNQKSRRMVSLPSLELLTPEQNKTKEGGPQFGLLCPAAERGQHHQGSPSKLLGAKRTPVAAGNPGWGSTCHAHGLLAASPEWLLNPSLCANNLKCQSLEQR